MSKLIRMPENADLGVLDANELLEVLLALKNGDFSKRMPGNKTGLAGKIADTLNDVIKANEKYETELKKTAEIVGTEGHASYRIAIGGLDDGWSRCSELVNLLIDSSAKPMLEMARVVDAVGHGDLSQSVAPELDGKALAGDYLRTAAAINAMVAQLKTLTDEAMRIMREIGSGGILSRNAEIAHADGVWAELTDSINTMANTRTRQTQDIKRVLVAVANGDLAQRITVEAAGEIGEVKTTVNSMIDSLSAFTTEIARVTREVGTNGRLGGQANVANIGGIWRELADGVNLMVGNLTRQMRDISKVAIAVANGDLSTKITVDVHGEILELKSAINGMVDQLGTFASEVTRVAREVGTEGRLGGQATVEGASGMWRDLIDSVNFMASSLTEQMRDISKVAIAVANGDLSTKITVGVRGEILELKNAINMMVDRLGTFASEVTRIAREVGTDGRLGGQANVTNVDGTWRELTDSVNTMVGNLTEQMRDISKVVIAVARGDLSTKITVDVRGEILELKSAINGMVDQLGTFASEVTRVAYEVGTEGKLGAQAHVGNADGMWRDLTNAVNTMSANITRQVRDVARVVTAIANGNLKKRMTVDSEGELADLTETIDSMIDTLASFAGQVTAVAHEVGVEGKLGGQASVSGAAGIWAGLTDNVNELAKNLTTQVRAINAVATAVSKGDLSHTITVEAAGEVAILKDNINEMIVALKETTRRNAEQDWLNTNLARFSRMLQGQRNLQNVCQMILSELATVVKMQHGVFYLLNKEEEEPVLKLCASYGFQERKRTSFQFQPGEGLLGQCLLEKQRILLTDVPGDYVRINSALGDTCPLNIVILPIIFENNVLAVMELASLNSFTDMYLEFLDQLAESIGIVVNTIHANSRTEELLKQSQALTEELQQQQEELTQTNEELEEKAKLLADQNVEVERKSDELEKSKHILEEKAEQLAITSKYKSEFLANMSHELRTPLNSLLVLAQQLTENPDGNLSEKQIEFAHIIYDSGNELLTLINDILDLSKIESGTVTSVISDIAISDIKESLDRTFRPIAESKGLGFDILIAKDTPAFIETDRQRIAQILKNLLSNAFKFTLQGGVTLSIGIVADGWTPGYMSLDGAGTVLAFRVNDTGIGIAPEKQKIIFEAFQQADGSTSRKYGGTGLGLAISREIAQILGGEICVTSEEGVGSAFTLYLPVKGKTDEKTVLRATPAGSADIARKETQALPVPASKSKPRYDGIADDRDAIQPGDSTLLIVEDDAKFAGILYDMSKSKGLKAIITLKGGNAIELAHQYLPSAIILDLRLPDIDGWTILERIRNDVDIRHIPVHIISAEDERIRGLQKGALTYLNKPVSKEDLEKTLDGVKTSLNISVQSILIVSADHKHWDAKKVLEGIDVKIISRSSGEHALKLLKKQPVDCVILDAKLSDMSAVQFVSKLQEDPALAELPVIVYPKEEMTQSDQEKLSSLAEYAIVREVPSLDRLLDEATLFLHKVIGNLPDTQKAIIRQIYQSDDILRDKKILIVDDDMRNIFALTSVLERHGIIVLAAESGKEAIDAVKNNPDVQIVLMDIMMPDMDGYETIRRIRKIPKYKDLTMIALTAKAMKGDREKCIEAGASDYITKPVDTAQLLSLLRVWLYK